VTTRASLAAVLAAAMLATACDGGPNDPTPEPVKPGIGIVAGAGTTDTVQATPVQALNVLVTSPDGKPAAGAPVLFESGFATVGTNRVPTMTVGPVVSSTFTTSVGATTDASGVASVRVRFGTISGEGKVVVTVPTLGFQDTARYNVSPGAVSRVTISPRDTALYVGKSYVLRGGAVDRFGNLRSDPVAFAVRSGPATVSGSQVAGTGIGRVTLAGQVGSMGDSVQLSVVPEGALAVFSNRTSRDSSGIVLVNLDGSGFTRLAPATASFLDHMAPDWAPSGQEVVFTDGGRIDSNSRLFKATLGGGVQPLIPSGGGAESWSRYTHDGVWIYYTRWPEVWRVRPDGTGAERAAPAAPGFGVDGSPDPSPDGTRLAYGTTRAGGVKMRILTLATGQVTTMDFSANVPRWSPDGQWIAFRDENDQSIRVVRPDGTGLRTISPAGRRYTLGHGWSPDGKWVIAAQETFGARLHLINVATGETLVLPFSTGMTQPAWKP
jgi:Tol biopolymer transport system component